MGRNEKDLTFFQCFQKWLPKSCANIVHCCTMNNRDYLVGQLTSANSTSAMNNSSVHFRHLCLFLHFHLLHFVHNLSHIWIMVVKSEIVVQILICFLNFCLSTLLPLPLVHFQQVLAANGVNCFISFGAFFAAVVLCQANGPEVITIFIRL